ncbi:T9SS sorting signal type C domain-containing protein [Flavobacterium pectinovorum]|uniref:T9SS sorting signal type C domain-containing protein n=1 Tax=Flavobacterium pectinovorum TaxID=29533 RepID=UPI001FABB3F8|nr:T9SS sorting signal type C domain-containing protein [Flavobacterium pectinovorum]MCI9844384.1 T9SS sorting signal type C domain-containing protein [Flavobacterium pectinovorum]
MKKTFITGSIFMISICSFAQSTTNAFNDVVGVSEKNIQFFNPSKTSKPSFLEKHRIWLNMTNTGGAFKQLLIGYIEGATNGYDSDYDGISLNANPFLDFYSINQGSNLVIQGRALPFKDSDVVPLGYRTIISGEFTISIDEVDGMLTNQAVYLEDKLTNVLHDLKENSYTFTTAVGVFNNRFALRYTNKSLAVDEFKTIKDAVSIGVKDQIVSINSSGENIDKIMVYDISGKQLSNKENIRDRQLIIHDLPSTREVLLVKVFLENGESITKKTLLK